MLLVIEINLLQTTMSKVYIVTMRYISFTATS